MTRGKRTEEEKTRFRLLRESMALTQEEMAKELGVPLHKIKYAEKPGVEISTSLTKRVARYLGHQVAWMLTTEHPEVSSIIQPAWTPPPREAASQQPVPPAQAADHPAGLGGFVAIPVYEPEVAAGVGAEVLGEKVVDWLLFKNEWIRSELRSAPTNLYLLYVTGPSMEPTLAGGDIVLVEKLDDGPLRDGVYVIRMRNSLLVKRLQMLPGGKVEVMSDNPAYRPFTVDLAALDDMEIVGRVVWAGKRF